MKMNAERPAECDWALAELGQRPPTPDTARRMEQHLANCEACRRARDWEHQLADILHDAPVAAPRGGIEQRVQALIARRSTRRWSGISAGLAAAVTLLVCGTIAWWMSDSRMSTGTRPDLTAGTTETGEPLSLDGLTILASEPPVPTLNRPQVAWLAVLTDAAEGESP